MVLDSVFEGSYHCPDFGFEIGRAFFSLARGRGIHELNVTSLHPDNFQQTISSHLTTPRLRILNPPFHPKPRNFLPRGSLLFLDNSECIFLVHSKATLLPGRAAEPLPSHFGV